VIFIGGCGPMGGICKKKMFRKIKDFRNESMGKRKTA
jgi:hypothetical protein